MGKRREAAASGGKRRQAAASGGKALVELSDLPVFADFKFCNVLLDPRADRQMGGGSRLTSERDQATVSLRVAAPFLFRSKRRKVDRGE